MGWTRGGVVNFRYIECGLDLWNCMATASLYAISISDSSELIHLYLSPTDFSVAFAVFLIS